MFGTCNNEMWIIILLLLFCGGDCGDCGLQYQLRLHHHLLEQQLLVDHSSAPVLPERLGLLLHRQLQLQHDHHDLRLRLQLTDPFCTGKKADGRPVRFLLPACYAGGA